MKKSVAGSQGMGRYWFEDEDPGFLTDPFSRSVEMVQCYVCGVSDASGASGFIEILGDGVYITGSFDVSEYVMSFKYVIYFPGGIALLKGISILSPIWTAWERYRMAEIQSLRAEQIRDELSDRGSEEGECDCTEYRQARLLLKGDWKQLDPQELGQVAVGGLTTLPTRRYPITELDCDDPLAFVLTHMDELPEEGAVISIPDTMGREFGDRLELTKAELRLMDSMFGLTK